MMITGMISLNHHGGELDDENEGGEFVVVVMFVENVDVYMLFGLIGLYPERKQKLNPLNYDS